jgi:hypothetical protein
MLKFTLSNINTYHIEYIILFLKCMFHINFIFFLPPIHDDPIIAYEVDLIIRSLMLEP